MGSWVDLLLHVVIGLPVYQILGTIRHGLSHAVAYLMCGYGVAELKLLPFRDERGHFWWGRVMPKAKAGARQAGIMFAAPHIVNLLCIVVWFALAAWKGSWFMEQVQESRLMFNVVMASTIMLLASPVFDTAVSVYKFRYGLGDFARLWTHIKFH